ncbi:MAG TPA: hypothetical protein VI653_13380 [Steroidobacteraceae bacterium]
MTAPALRLATPEPSLGESLLGLCDIELERNILGAAMLAEPMPRWLAPEHFFPSHHKHIYQSVQAVGGNLPLVAAHLREGGRLFRADWHGYDRDRLSHSRLSPIDLVEMTQEARWVLDRGWALDFERLRELAKRRAFVSLAKQLITRLSATGYEDMSHAECLEALRDYFKGVK